MKNLNVINRLNLFCLFCYLPFSGFANTITRHLEKTETRQVSSFTKLDIGGGFKVILQKADKQNVNIEADAKDLNNISTEVKNGTLHIRNLKSDWNSKNVTIYIDAESLSALAISGAVELKSIGLFTAEKFEMTISGAGNVDFQVDTKLLVTKLRGAAELNLKGKVDTHAVETSGASQLNAYNLQTDKSVLNLNGASDCEISVLSELVVSGSGASEVKYKGNPTKISKHTSGASEISKVD